MYICPVCNNLFDTEEDVSKHSLKCWRAKNPNHKSKPAPHSEDKIEREVTNEVLDFFASFQKEN